ncbi:undecaprenyl-diphosphatase [Thiobacillus sedimenti]|uniref:Undecaprenyl-diphosphatase n=1 Tax=Thiobacillus sedimenti TaxID=3110231 RepID=A0ABZ1CMI3_9PROT|nr:undecaprenyl-diphosphatase [Thiobacillus sp. SCUT-2]WRS40621.1 undecaprenyl-diphosphatase [Thiobacillus sp. SCUT-2]
MEHLSQAIFLLLNAGPHASPRTVDVARLLAEDVIWLVPLGLVLGWLRGSTAAREALLSATAAGLTGLLLNQIIGLAWYHPRPFEAGIGRTLIQHVQDSSFPSDHLTLIWAVATNLALHQQTRLAGWSLALLGLPVAWARIYLGVHFPADMLGASVVGLFSAGLMRRLDARFAEPLARRLQPLYRMVCASLIRRGWARE